MFERFNLSAWAVRERALTLYFILLISFIGLYAFVSLGRAEDPSFTIKVMTVTTQWPGATALEMQQQVADRLEKRLQEVAFFDRVETTARPGLAVMQIQFLDETPASEIQTIFYEVRKRMLDEAPRLPQGVIGPIVNDDFADVYFSLYAITSTSQTQYELIPPAEKLRDQLLQVPGVQKVNLIGERPHQLHVNLDLDRLAQLNISAQSVMETIAAQNQLLPSGFIETQAGRTFIRLNQDLTDLDQLAALPIQVGEQLIALGDIASIEQAYQDPPRYLIRDQGQDALMLGVVMKPGFNGIQLGDNLAKIETALQAQLPLDIEFEQITNQADAIKLAVNEFQLKFLLALGVVMLVSFIALGLRAGLVVALAVPLTLAITFFIMMLTGKNLDRITLGALILALGLLVDDAIIAIEMMLVKIEEGLDKVKAASYAWSVTAMPMLIGTLITAVGFVPIGFAASNVGEYAGNIFWVLAIALTASWLVAVIFTPYLGVKLLKNHGHTMPLTAQGQNAYQTKGYQLLRKLVEGCVQKRKRVLFSTLLLFILAIVGMATKVEQQFFPSSDRPELMIDIYLPEGSRFASTDAVTKTMETLLKEQPEVLSLSSYIGAGAPRFFMALNPELPNPAFAKLIAITADRYARDRLQQRLQTLIAEGAFPEARVRVHPLLYGPPVAWPVTFRVMGEDPIMLRNIAHQVRDIVAAHPATLEPHLDYGQRVPVVKLEFDLQRLKQLGLNRQTLHQQLQFALQGQSVTELRMATRSVALIVRADDHAKITPDKLAELLITSSKGETIPLGQVASIMIDFEDPVLKRRNRTPYLSVNSEISAGAQPPDVTFDIWPELMVLNQDLPLGYRIEIGGSVEESAKAQSSIQVLMPVMVILMITLIMLMMRSFSGTLMVLLTAPLGLIGAVAALVIFSQPFGFVATLGLIGLAGILMRNTLILVGQINDNKRQGMPDYEAVVDATIRRARPVVLTALAAVMAFIPLTTSTFWGPLAYVLIGGISMGTLLTLLFLPALYSVWFRVNPNKSNA